MDYMWRSKGEITVAKRKKTDIVPIMVRLREDLRQRLAQAAEAQQRSLNNEISARLQESFEMHGRQQIEETAASLNREAKRLQEERESMGAEYERLVKISQRIGAKYEELVEANKEIVAGYEGIVKEKERIVADNQSIKAEWSKIAEFWRGLKQTGD
jgi:predicted  nucleic acid-binding Zn-ribbon protein